MRSSIPLISIFAPQSQYKEERTSYASLLIQEKMNIVKSIVAKVVALF